MTVIDAASGEVRATTRFDSGVRNVVVPAPDRAFVQAPGGAVLVGAD